MNVTDFNWRATWYTRVKCTREWQIYDSLIVCRRIAQPAAETKPDPDVINSSLLMRLYVTLRSVVSKRHNDITPHEMFKLYRARQKSNP